MKKLALLLTVLLTLASCASAHQGRAKQCVYAQPYRYSANTPSRIDHLLDWLEYKTERVAAVFIFPRECGLVSWTATTKPPS